MYMTGAHSEAVLNTLSQANFVHLILNAEANLVSQIAKLSTEVKVLVAHSQELETDVTFVRNVNTKLVERVVVTECQCWENAQ